MRKCVQNNLYLLVAPLSMISTKALFECLKCTVNTHPCAQDQCSYRARALYQLQLLWIAAPGISFLLWRVVCHSEDYLLCTHTVIHCLLFAVGSVRSVNGGRTPEYVPEDAELVAAKTVNLRNVSCSVMKENQKTTHWSLITVYVMGVYKLYK